MELLEEVAKANAELNDLKEKYANDAEIQMLETERRAARTAVWNYLRDCGRTCIRLGEKQYLRKCNTPSYDNITVEHIDGLASQLSLQNIAMMALQKAAQARKRKRGMADPSVVVEIKNLLADAAHALVATAIKHSKEGMEVSSSLEKGCKIEDPAVSDPLPADVLANYHLWQQRHHEVETHRKHWRGRIEEAEIRVADAQAAADDLSVVRDLEENVPRPLDVGGVVVVLKRCVSRSTPKLGLKMLGNLFRANDFGAITVSANMTLEETERLVREHFTPQQLTEMINQVRQDVLRAQKSEIKTTLQVELP